MNSVFQYCPRCGKKSVGFPEPKLIVCGECDFHFYRNPATATAAIVADASGKILLIRRAKDPSKGKLGMPGGFVDIGEAAEAGLRREVREEVALDIRDVNFLVSFPNSYVYRGVTYPTVDLFFTAQVESFDSAQSLSEVEGLVILDPADVAPDDLAFDSMRHAIRVYRSR